MDTLKIVAVVSTLTLIWGCARQHEKVTYYANGQVHEKFVFPSADDEKTMKNYKGTLYYSNGTPQICMTKEAGYTEGEYITYYENGKVKSISMYRKDTLNGVYRTYSKNGELVEESLYLKGEHVIMMKSFYSNNRLIDFFYYTAHHQNDEMGQLVHKDNGAIDTTLSFYYQAIGKDTISEGDKYNLAIYIYTEDIKCYVAEAVFGDFNASFDVRDSIKYTFLSSSNNRLNYSYIPSKRGRNLILGKIHVINTPDSKEKVDRDFIFFKDFFVK